MPHLVRGGRTLYGQPLGILMLDTRFPRPPGDVGNALTWPFPVRYKIVTGVASRHVVGTADPKLIQPFVDGARELEAEGVRAITTSCGFLAIFQREMAAAVSVPVLSSALLQVPGVARMLAPGRRVVIMTPHDELTERHFNGVGWSSESVRTSVVAFPKDAMFTRVYSARVPEPDVPEADTDQIKREVLDVATTALSRHPDLGAIVMECTNLVPYSQAVRERFGVPVFDLHTLVTQAVLAITGTEFPRPAAGDLR